MAYSGRMPATAQQWIDALGLQPHPEGGYFRRHHASALEVEVAGRLRPAMTAIHYLLATGERSRWHRVDADEAWHWQQGGTLDLLQFDATSGTLSRTRLGPPDGGQMSCIVPAGIWQSAFAPDEAVLVTCTVAPGFVWEGFELLDPRGEVAQRLARLDALHP